MLRMIKNSCSAISRITVFISHISFSVMNIMILGSPTVEANSKHRIPRMRIGCSNGTTTRLEIKNKIEN